MGEDATLVAERGDELRLRRRANGDTHRWLVEQVRGGQVTGTSEFEAEEARAAIDLLDERYVALLREQDATPGTAALVAALRWGLAHRAADIDALDALMTDESSLHDHRHLGVGDIPKDQLLMLLEPSWGDAVAVVSRYPEWDAGAVLAEVVYIGGADPHPLERSGSLTVFTVDERGRIAAMDTYDADGAGAEAARVRYGEIVSGRSGADREART